MPLGETLYAYFPMGSSSLPVVVAQPDERLAKKPQKVLCVGVVGQMQLAWFTLINKETKSSELKLNHNSIIRLSCSNEELEFSFK